MHRLSQPVGEIGLCAARAECQFARVALREELVAFDSGARDRVDGSSLAPESLRSKSIYRTELVISRVIPRIFGHLFLQIECTK